MKVTNTEHTAINGNQSKCRMTQFNLGGALTKSGNIQVGGYSDSIFLPLLLYRIGLAISVSLLPISDAVHCNPSRYAQGSAVLCCRELKGCGEGKHQEEK